MHMCYICILCIYIYIERERYRFRGMLRRVVARTRMVGRTAPLATDVSIILAKKATAWTNSQTLHVQTC